MPARPAQTAQSGRPSDLRTVFVAGGAAGALASPVGAFKVGDEIVSVARFTTATFVPGTDLTAEFLAAMPGASGTSGAGTVSVADTISNLGGTSTAAQLLLVTYARAATRLG